MGLLITALSLVFFILYPLGEIFSLSFAGGIRLSPIDVGVGLLAVIGISRFIRQKPPFSKILLSIGLFLLTCIISLLVNSITLTLYPFLNASLYFLRFVLYVSVILTISQGMSQEKRKIPLILFFSGLLLMIIGYGQYFLFPSLRGLTYEGWDPHFYRMFGTFLDPNFFGSFLVLFILVSLSLFSQKTSGRIFFGIVTVLAIVALFLTFSRSAYIALSVGIVMFLFCKGYKTRILQSLFVLIVIGATVILLLAKQTEGNNLLRTASTAARFNNLFRAGTIIHDNPVFGIGFNAYKYEQYRRGFEAAPGWDNSHGNNGVNNSYLFVWATTGIIGLTAYFLFLRTVFRAAWKEKKYNAFIIASFAAMAVNGLFENTLFYTFIMLWLFILVGLIESNEQ